MEKNRRRVVTASACLAGASVLPVGFMGCSAPADPMASVEPYVKAGSVWTPSDFAEFLKALPRPEMFKLQSTLGLVRIADSLKGPELDAHAVQTEAQRRSRSFWNRDDPRKLDYHLMTMDTRRGLSVSPNGYPGQPTFESERELLQGLFAELWDKLDKRSREELLARLEVSGSRNDRAAMASLTGAAALAALSATTAFAGFSFYTAMSTTIAVAAGAAGVTVPFAVYTSASSLVAALSGPVGWAAMGLMGLGGVALLLRPDYRKTANLIGLVHALKVQALSAAGVRVTGSSGRVFR